MLALCSLMASGAAADYRDSLMQPPTLQKPGRGSVAGTVGDLSFGPAELSRGSHSLATPIEVPDDRGPLLASVLPTYSPEGGLTEWGMGWSNNLTIQRSRDIGDLDYATDEFVTPWGKMIAGNDGTYYIRDFAAKVRFQFNRNTWVALTEDGARYTFPAAETTSNSRGVYTWYLSKVESPTGERTDLSYEANASGRRFLKTVLYASLVGKAQYRLRFEYDSIDVPVPDYRSGQLVLMDRRVSKVFTDVHDATRGSYVERWHHDLDHLQSPAGVAFYLEHVTKVYASGATEPTVTYDYALAEDALAAANLVALGGLEDLLRDNGADGIQPDVISYFDYEEDGSIEIEDPYDYARLRRTESGWTRTPLPAASGTLEICRDPRNVVGKRPRELVRMRPSTEPHVLVTAAHGASTNITICDYQGRSLFQGSAAGAWYSQPNTHLVDIDRDLKPDFVSIERGGYRILSNQSTATQFSFVKGKTGVLSPAIDPDSSGVRDFNGDGEPDLFARTRRHLSIWYGLGGSRFAEVAQEFTFEDRTGTPLSDIREFEMTIGDFNADGLADIVFSSGAYLYLFTNRGTYFAEVAVPGFDEITAQVSYPVAVDLAGRGEEQAVMVGAAGALAVTLSRPESGLMVGVDDGKGGQVRFEYQRARPNPGIVRRPPLLTKMTVSASGEETLEYVYDYLDPRFHTQSQHLVGYNTVRRTSPLTVEAVTFTNDDEAQGVMTYSATSDAFTPDIFRVQSLSYDRVRVVNVPWMRPKVKYTGWATRAKTITGAKQETLSYSGLCDKLTETTTVHGKLREDKTFDRPAKMNGALHCITSSELVTGTHPNRPQLDFTYRADISHNEVGQVTKVVVQGQTIQEVQYDARYRPSAFISPQTGRVEVGYRADTGLIDRVSHANGKVDLAQSYDPVSDHMLALSESMTGGVQYLHNFRFDEKERLSKHWTNLAGSEAAPLTSYVYQEADASHPAHIALSTLLDPQTSVTRQEVEFQSATGRKLAKAQLAMEGWLVGELTLPERARGASVQMHRLPLDSAVPLADVDLATLFTDSTELVEQVSSAHGHVVSSQSVLQEGVERSTNTTVTISNNQLVHTTRENGALPTTVTKDATGLVLASSDAAGKTTRFAYDALNRLVSVTLPDGVTTQSVTYDAQGRPEHMAHDGAGRIGYQYRADNGLLSGRTFEAEDGTLTRSESYRYDALGRVDLLTASSGGDTMEYHRTYDGRTAEGQIPGQAGQLTTVSGPGYKSHTEYNPDGTLRRSRVQLADWRTVQVDNTYYADGSLATARRTLSDASGRVLNVSERENVIDSYGRLDQVLLNGEVFYDIAYDGEGRIDSVTLPNGDALTVAYDAVTHRARGYEHRSADFTLAVDQQLNERALVAAEHVSYRHGDGAATSHDRSYGYDARRFLVSSSGADGSATYGYDDNGLIDTTSDARGERSFAVQDGEMVAGDIVYRYDAAGRVVERGDLVFTYGPHGHIARVDAPTKVIEFVYDESGRRVAKLENGRPVMGYLEGNVITEDAFIETVKIADRVVGVLENGQFRSVPTDPRGTVLATDDGYLHASPYGVRMEHPDVAAALDFVATGYDADLGTVRMGVRDYDPHLGQFLTPDPLFMEDVEKCAESPVECTLYGYAVNDPISYIDPTGTQSKKPRDIKKVEEKTEIYVDDPGAAASMARQDVTGTNPGTILGMGEDADAPRPPLVNLSPAEAQSYDAFFLQANGGAKQWIYSDPSTDTLIVVTHELRDRKALGPWVETTEPVEVTDTNSDGRKASATRGSSAVDVVDGKLTINLEDLLSLGAGRSRTVGSTSEVRREIERTRGREVKRTEAVKFFTRRESARLVTTTSGRVNGRSFLTRTTDVGRVEARVYQRHEPW